MNNIKKFEDFSLNELKHSTYFDAARKLRRLGGHHHTRARRIERHSYLIGSKDLGEFNLNVNLIEKMSHNYLTKKDEKMLFAANPDEKLKLGETLYKKSPLPIYFTGGHIMDPRESFTDDEISNCEVIDIMCFGIPSQEERFSDTFELFNISIPITWENDIFKISDDPISFIEMDNGVLKFADRKSAIKFRNILGNQELMKKYVDGFDQLREFFMEYSDASEWDKFFEKIRSINTNQLYN